MGNGLDRGRRPEENGETRSSHRRAVACLIAFGPLQLTLLPAIMVSRDPGTRCRDLDRSLACYVGVIGYKALFDRPEERRGFLGLEGVHRMLEEAAGPGHRLPRHPYGHGVNFMMIGGRFQVHHAHHKLTRRTAWGPSSVLRVTEVEHRGLGRIAYGRGRLK
jgi:hypothetical protein